MRERRLRSDIGTVRTAVVPKKPNRSMRNANVQQKNDRARAAF
jgi:hypothetical protein